MILPSVCKLGISRVFAKVGNIGLFFLMQMNVLLSENEIHSMIDKNIWKLRG